MSVISKEAETAEREIFFKGLRKEASQARIQQAIDTSTAPLEFLLREGLALHNDNRGHLTELERWQSKVREVIKPAPVAE